MRSDGLANFLPAIRDASLLVLLNRLLKAGQTAAELMSLGGDAAGNALGVLIGMVCVLCSLFIHFQICYFLWLKCLLDEHHYVVSDCDRYFRICPFHL